MTERATTNTARDVASCFKKENRVLGAWSQTFGFANSYIRARARKRSSDRGKNPIELSPNQNKRYWVVLKYLCLLSFTFTDTITFTGLMSFISF